MKLKKLMRVSKNFLLAAMFTSPIVIMGCKCKDCEGAKGAKGATGTTGPTGPSGTGSAGTPPSVTGLTFGTCFTGPNGTWTFQYTLTNNGTAPVNCYVVGGIGGILDSQSADFPCVSALSSIPTGTNTALNAIICSAAESGASSASEALDAVCIDQTTGLSTTLFGTGLPPVCTYP